MSVNKVILLGRLGQDPELKYTPGGAPVCNFSLATTEAWTDKGGQKQEKTEWHRVVILNDNLVTVAKNYLKKGQKVYLEGALQTRKWQDKDGQDRYSTEVVLQGYGSNLTMLDRPGGEQRSGGGRDEYSQEPSYQSQSAPRSSRPVPEQLDDEIPF